MPGGGSRGSALTARHEGSSSDPRRWFMGHGVTRCIRAGTRCGEVRPLSGVARHPTVIEPIAEFLAGPEVWRRLLVHLDRLAGTRIAPDAGVALLHREGAETAHLHTLASSQSGSDLLEYRRHDQLHIRNAQMWVAGGKVRDEF